MIWRRGFRRLIEPALGVPRRLPLGPAAGIRLEGDPVPSLDTWLGLFESELSPYIRRLCAPGTRCVDVGAWQGYYALVFAKLASARVIAYEPDAEAAARCRQNLALNPRLASLVELRQVPVGATADPQRSVVTLDQDVWDCPPGLIKIDVDRAELDVLRGARQVLAGPHPHVIVETHSLELEHACGDELVRAGYKPIVVTQRRLFPQHRPTAHNRWLVAEGWLAAVSR